jgi:hypothetical protein
MELKVKFNSKYFFGVIHKMLTGMNSLVYDLS